MRKKPSRQTVESRGMLVIFFTSGENKLRTPCTVYRGRGVLGCGPQTWGPQLRITQFSPIMIQSPPAYANISRNTLLTTDGNENSNGLPVVTWHKRRLPILPITLRFPRAHTNTSRNTIFQHLREIEFHWIPFVSLRPFHAIFTPFTNFPSNRPRLPTQLSATQKWLWAVFFDWRK